MIITKHTTVRNKDIKRYAWSELRKFHNVRYTSDCHINLLSVPHRFKKFADKQASHIRYSLIQAREYAVAAETATLATRPVLLYYSCMSLALAEILMKQAGDSSLDKARSEHNHHGLSLQADEEKIRKHSDFLSVASALKAIPMFRNKTTRAGTFELWHKSARGMPIIGRYTELYADGPSVSHHATILYPGDVEYSRIERSGMSLISALANIPSMSTILHTYGVDSEFVRGRVERVINYANNSNVISHIIHPMPQNESDNFFSLFEFKNPRVDGFEFYSNEKMGGGIFNLSTTGEYFDECLTPEAINTTTENVMFWKKDAIMNEFGYIYVALHILGNFARYFPDLWIKSVENSEPIATIAESFLEIAEEKLPLLCLNEMSRSCHIAAG